MFLSEILVYHSIFKILIRDALVEHGLAQIQRRASLFKTMSMDIKQLLSPYK